MNMLERNNFLARIHRGLRMYGIVALLGPSKYGKTTLANIFANNLLQEGTIVKKFDLEDPQHLR